MLQICKFPNKSSISKHIIHKYTLLMLFTDSTMKIKSNNEYIASNGTYYSTIFSIITQTKSIIYNVYIN